MGEHAKWGRLELPKRILYGCAAPLQMSGIMLDSEDTKRVLLSYILWILLYQDYIDEIHSYLGIVEGEASVMIPHCSSRDLFQEMKHRDVEHVNADFKGALLALRHLPVNRRPRRCSINRRDYKRLRSKMLHHLEKYGMARGSIMAQELVTLFVIIYVTGSAACFRMVNSLTQFNSRLTLRFKHKKGELDWMTKKAIDDYKEFEKILVEQKDSYPMEAIAAMRSVINDWFPDSVSFSDHKIKADHGYGATAEVGRSIGTDAKYHSMVPTLQSYYLSKYFDWLPDDRVAWKGLTSGHYAQHHALKVGCYVDKELLGKVQMVPKGINKKRTVSMEPTVNQFFQKMIGKWFSDYFDKKPDMMISLHDQEHNRDLAQFGSLTGLYATIDLSNASDSVTLTIVKEIFKDRPQVLRVLLWARTTKVVLPDESTLELEKFAPMGAGDCFPIECIVFSALIESVLRDRGVHAYYRVYGDDCIVPTEIYDDVISRMESLHFYPNLDKSYGHGSAFTESCGGEYWNGYDVSPLRMSRKFDWISMLQAMGNPTKPEKPKTDKRCKTFKSDWISYRKRLQKWMSWYECKDGNDLYGRRLAQRWVGFTMTNGAKIRKLMPYMSPDANGTAQLYGNYCLANDAYCHGAKSVRMAIVRMTLELFEGAYFSHNWSYGFFSPKASLDNRVKIVYDRDTYSTKMRVQTLDSSIEYGPDESRYSKLIEEYDTTTRKSLCDPSDRLDVRAGAASTRLAWIDVPECYVDCYASDLPTVCGAVLTNERFRDPRRVVERSDGAQPHTKDMRLRRLYALARRSYFS